MDGHLHKPLDAPAPDDAPYDKRRLSYANTFNNPFKVNVIRAMEWMTGKVTLLRLIRRFEAMGAPHGQPFWKQALDIMGIEVQTPTEQLSHIPKTGPLIVVANHPHGLVDGMVLAELLGRVREDYQILVRSILTGVQEIDHFMIPVPFSHEDNAQKRSLEMRKRAMDHLKIGGAIVLFPSGVVASSRSMFGPAIEAEWNPFTAKMIQRSGARVVPVYFPGSNSRWYQIANRVSPTLRQGLLLHEVAYALNKPQAPVIGPIIDRSEITSWADNPRGFVQWLRDMTLSLGDRR
ncbi:lysophospholipid acyltransferase family protein [Actibacterium sp.]|uniref:lysophospholipid acyltransferase family protein n=1 Tax=Actibacterium sp. TaxID=1872125 RepID=UPI003567C2DB